jgi:hypothetical protein
MSKTGKIVLAAVLGIAAILLILWDFDVFAGKPPPPPDPTANYTPAEKQELQKEQQQRIEWEKKQKAPSGA